MTDSERAALLSEVRRLAAKDRSVGSAAMTRLAELAPRLADALTEELDWRADWERVPLVERIRQLEELVEQEQDRANENAGRIFALEGGIVAEARRATAEIDGLRSELDMTLNNLETALAERAELRALVTDIDAALATERGKRCGSCRHWEDESCRRVKRAWAEANTQWRLVLGTAADFGCTEWEAKG